MIYAYVAAIVLAVTMVVPSLAELVRQLRRSNENERSQIVADFVRQGGSSLPTLNALSQLRPWGTTQLRAAVGFTWFLVSLPVFLLRMAIAKRWGVEVLWRLPVDLYVLWQLGWIAQAYAWAEGGEVGGALAIAILVAAGALNSLLNDLEPTADGRPRIFTTPRHKLHLHEPVMTAVVIVAAFGCIYFSLGLTDPNAFTAPMGVVQSLYYSMLVGTTVGFSDIQPKSDLLRATTAVEAFLGYIFIILFIAVHVGVWTDRHRKVRVTEEVSETETE